MNKKSMLMPHACQKIGWGLLILAVLAELAKVLFVHDIELARYLAKATHITLVISLFFICMSREKVEDEMISGFRLKSIGISAYVFFPFLLVLSLILGELELSPYLSEFFIIILPIILSVLYYVIFKGMIWKSKKQ